MTQEFSNSESFKQAAFYSPTSSSVSSSSSSSSSSDYQRKKVRRRKKEKIRKERNFVKTAVNPNQVVKRYKKILRQFRHWKNLRSSYKAAGVDRNTVVSSAAIAAELAIVS
ncbi:coiled-coil domain-containing protein 106-like [Carassius auratus]|uniref:Coiled-coil domain-containing protein 106-like n=1 Tax=Carassius auratus TaxID=7957 RepID=A0A6P6JXG3_CARAU|nr:coiled-coil domain-containing protein 106-like [Carassius auratus]